MTEQQTELLEGKDPNVIEDLALAESETANIKGGPMVDHFRDLNGIQGETSDQPHR